MQINDADALIVVDVQNDFVTGSLAVPGAQQIIPVINAYIKAFAECPRPVFLTQCQHRQDHPSFKDQGGPWPSHCVVGTAGAEAAELLLIPPKAYVIHKGANVEQYSGFDNWILPQLLQDYGIHRVFICGLATDYCVKATALAALAHGYETVVLVDAVKGVNVKPDDVHDALHEMMTAEPPAGTPKITLKSRLIAY